MACLIQLLTLNRTVATILLEHHHIYVKSKDISIPLGNFPDDKCTLTVLF